jgi:hypothetical protein
LEAVTGMARWFAQQGVPEQAFVSAFFVLNHQAATQQTTDDARQLMSELELLLGAEEAEAAQARAENLSLEALVTSLLSAGPRTGHRPDEGQAS